MYASRLTSILIYPGLLLLCLGAISETVDTNNQINLINSIDTTETTDETLDFNTLPLYIIRKIQFNGNKHFNQRRLHTLFGWQRKKVYSRQAMLEGFERVLSAYRKEGYVFVLINPPVITPITSNNRHISIKISIKEGKRLRIGAFSLIGNQLFPKSILLRELGLRKGRFFSQSSLEEGIVRVQLLYSEHGHPKVEIEPKITNLSPKTGTIDFLLQINEGAKVRINEIKVSGLKKTKSEVVLREIPIRPNDEFDQRKIELSYHKLRNIGYFHDIDPNFLDPGPTDDTITFHAKVAEARTGSLIGVLGYAPPVEEFDSAPQLTGIFEVREKNLLGTGRDVNFYWKSGLLRALRIGYKEPWILGKPVTLGVAYSQLKQRNQFNDSESEEKAATLSGSTVFGRYYECDVILGYKHIQFGGIVPAVQNTVLPDSLNQINNDSLDTIPSQIESGTKYSITLRVTRDSRDYYLNPTRGRRDSFAVELSRSEFKLRKLWFDIQQYLQILDKQIVAFELHGAAAWGINIPPTELFYLGGASTLRGFDEDWFSGPRRINGSLEYRFLTGRNSQLFTFVDFGSVTFIDRPNVFDKFRVGYGFGARLESKGAIIQLDYGLAAGESALRGKIHVKLGASF